MWLFWGEKQCISVTRQHTQGSWPSVTGGALLPSSVFESTEIWSSAAAVVIIILVSIAAYFFSSVAQSCLTLCDPMDCSPQGLPVYHQLPEFTQTHVHEVGDAIQPSYPLSSPSPPALNLSQHQGLFKWVSSSHQVAKVLELQLQRQSFQRIFRTDFL